MPSTITSATPPTIPSIHPQHPSQHHTTPHTEADRHTHKDTHKDTHTICIYLKSRQIAYSYQHTRISQPHHPSLPPSWTYGTRNASHSPKWSRTLTHAITNTMEREGDTVVAIQARWRRLGGFGGLSFPNLIWASKHLSVSEEGTGILTRILHKQGGVVGVSRGTDRTHTRAVSPQPRVKTRRPRARRSRSGRSSTSGKCEESRTGRKPSGSRKPKADPGSP